LFSISEDQPKSAFQTPLVSAFFGCMNWLFWALLSAIFAGLTAILAKVGVKGVDSNLATAVRTGVVLVFAWSVALATNPANAVFQLSKRTWLFLTLSGIATGLSWLCYFRALQLGEASRVAPIDKLSVVFVLVFAALFLGEAMTWKTIAGGSLITLGALLLAT
jgi:bacterial/archaeal transporter family protein